MWTKDQMHLLQNYQGRESMAGLYFHKLASWIRNAMVDLYFHKVASWIRTSCRLLQRLINLKLSHQSKFNLAHSLQGTFWKMSHCWNQTHEVNHCDLAVCLSSALTSCKTVELQNSRNSDSLYDSTQISALEITVSSYVKEIGTVPNIFYFLSWLK